MHVIRLRGPWQKGAGPDTVPVRIDVPEVEVVHESSQSPQDRTYDYRRNFNLPSGLQESSRVFLRVDGWQGRIESAELNGTPLDVSDGNINVDITSFLEPQNQIRLRLTNGPGQAARLSGEVTLAIDDDHS